MSSRPRPYIKLHVGRKRKLPGDTEDTEEVEDADMMMADRSSVDVESDEFTDADDGINADTTDCASIFQDKTFTFLIGPKKIRYTVHQAVFKDISQPLAYLMSNGNMRESLKGKAHLEDVEPVVFNELLAYAYNGVYGLRSGIQKWTTTESTNARFRCHDCGVASNRYDSPSRYPFCTDTCQARAQTAFRQHGSRTPMRSYCVHFDCTDMFVTPILSAKTRAILCGRHNSPANRLIFCDDMATNLATLQSKALQRPFAHREYGSAKFNHSELRSLFQLLRDVSQPVIDIGFHARIYVLADRYMIADLKDISLHKLHSNLVAIEITAETMIKVVELINYIYANTNDGGDTTAGNTDKLRDLITAYVVEHSKEAVKHSAFQDMLSAGGAHTAALFTALAQIKE